MQVTKVKAVSLLVALGVATAKKWSVARLTKEIRKINTLVEEDQEVDGDGNQELLDELLEAIENETEITVVEGKKAAGKGTAKKGAKGTKKKSTKKKTPPADEDEEEEDEEEAPAPKKGKKKTAADGKGGKTKKGKKPPKKVGVIATIIEILKKATSKKPVSKDDIVTQLADAFPERDADSMRKTVNVQVPTRIQGDKGLTVNKNDNGYWIS